MSVCDCLTLATVRVVDTVLGPKALKKYAHRIKLLKLMGVHGWEDNVLDCKSGGHGFSSRCSRVTDRISVLVC